MTLATSLAWGALGLSAAGSLFQFGGNQREADYYRQASEYNARMLEREAAYRKMLYELKARQVETTGTEIISQQRVGYASAGVRVDTGTPQEVAIDTRKQVDYQAALARWGGVAEMNNLLSQAAMTRFQGSRMADASEIDAYGSLLGGAGRFLSLGSSLTAGHVFAN